MILYNSLSHKREEFVPHEPGKVSIYTCGPTVYHYAHIGNLRTYIMEDVLEKYLRYAGYDVTRVMNITDVGHLTSDADEGEDKMLKGAKREHKTVMEIAHHRDPLVRLFGLHKPYRHRASPNAFAHRGVRLL